MPVTDSALGLQILLGKLFSPGTMVTNSYDKSQLQSIIDSKQKVIRVLGKRGWLRGKNIFTKKHFFSYITMDRIYTSKINAKVKVTEKKNYNPF